jgi:protein required for attachment to host cells
MAKTTDTVTRQWSLDWVVVANATKARVFERDDENGAMRELADYMHAASRQKGVELTGDRPGLARKSQAATVFAPHATPQEREHARFAHELAQALEQAAKDRRMPGLQLFASDPFLGEVKAELGDAARRVLKSSIATDLTAFKGRDLEQRVSRALQDKGGPTH